MIVLHPVNLNINMVVMITPAEQHCDRSTFNINAVIRQMTLNIDLDQLSDLFDLGKKFQNYSTLYGIEFVYILI